MSVLPLLIISRACAGVMRGTAALATSIICFTLVVMTFLPSIDDVLYPPKSRHMQCKRQCPLRPSGHWLEGQKLRLYAAFIQVSSCCGVWSLQVEPKEKRRGDAYDYYHVWKFVIVRT